jgi:formamidopyrimidine-DNA glycosylase
MSGSLRIASAGEPHEPHVHVAFPLASGRELRFRDPRKFGRVYVLEAPGPVTGPLGPEPLDPSFTPAAFATALRRRRGRLKPLLLDQRFLAGLGNIYVDESLWHARLHPLRSAATVTQAEAEGLLASIRHVLEGAVGARGTTFSTPGFRGVDGTPGMGARDLAVFRRDGRPCPRCGTLIERLVVGGRGTHVCPVCQVVKPSHGSADRPLTRPG